jgi:hypothetical protein
LLTAPAAVVLPTAARGREAVAEMFGQPIYRDELSGPRALGARIVPPLIKRLVKAKHLEATDAEIADLQSWIGGLSGDEGEGPMTASTDAERQQLRESLASVVLDWKINKALYEQYGGDVIFQQFSPREAVGAMRKYLEDQEASGTFKIFDAAERDSFYAYYRRRDHPGGFVPPEKVDYSVPWWRQRPR